MLKENFSDIKTLFTEFQNWREPFFGLTVQQWKKEREEAYSKFRQVFDQARLPRMTAEDFHSFLDLNVNKSWTGLYRQGKKATEDMERLRRALSFLQDESVDIDTRVREALRKDGSYKVPGMGKNLVTAILHVFNPKKYCVWNNRVEDSLKRLGKMPSGSIAKPGRFYRRINSVAMELAEELSTDLTTMDMFMYYLSSEGRTAKGKERKEKAFPYWHRSSAPPGFPQELLSEYAGVEYIGEGGFATVYQARRKDGQTVALKIPRLDKKTSKIFLKEIAVWLQLRHHNIVNLYNADYRPVEHIEMEYVPGLDYQGERVRDLEGLPKPVDLETATQLVVGIAEGLSHTHSRGIWHRDLKPLNVLLTREMSPKITDWGLAKLSATSKFSVVKGYTPLYSAPEILDPESYGDPDHRTDIYQLGLIFYELLTDHLPYEGSNQAQILSKIISERSLPEKPSGHNPGAKPHDRTIMKCLAKRKEDRYQSVEELRDALLGHLKKEYKKSLKQSISQGNMKRSAFYCGELCLVHARRGDLKEALKFANDLVGYASGEVRGEMGYLIEMLEYRLERDLEIDDELYQKMDILLHQVKMGGSAEGQSRGEVAQKQPRQEEKGRGQAELERIQREREKLRKEREELERKKKEEERRKQEEARKKKQKEEEIKRREEQKRKERIRKVISEAESLAKSGEQLIEKKEFNEALKKLQKAKRKLEEENLDSAGIVNKIEEAKKLEKEEKKKKEAPKGITNSIGMEMVYIPAGEFDMGSPDSEKGRFKDEGPVHRVKISKPFYIGRYPVTQKQWEEVMGSNPSFFKGDNRPVERVSWNNVQEFIKRLNEMEGTDKYRLPTEAEWEYAARAGTQTAYSFGDDPSKLGEYAWYGGNSRWETHPVGQKKPNPWGLYDVHGNVWEWVQDWYDLDYYAKSPRVDPQGPSSGSGRVGRGGGWFINARNCRSAYRYYNGPSSSNCYLGFRLVRSL